MTTLLRMIEKKEAIRSLLPKDQAGLTIKIGKENEKIGLNNISIISATYSLGNNQLGTIAVLGPTRMEYSRVIALMQMITSQINNLISPKD
jgi:heat-inducible transcriptional repressor